MNAPSDILILFSAPLDDDPLHRAKSVLMQVGKSVLAHHKEGQNRLLIVKFNPADVKPLQLLEAVQNAGFDAKMAGG